MEGEKEKEKEEGEGGRRKRDLNTPDVKRMMNGMKQQYRQ